MKSKAFLTAGLTAISLLSAFPTMTAFAGSSSIPTFNASINAENVSPRYRFIQSATIAVHPNKSETVYTLDISGIETVTSVSGTATLYKKNSSGNYVKIDSEELSFRGSSVSYKGHLTSSGSGSYKIEFVGTVYTATGSESITSKANAQTAFLLKKLRKFHAAKERHFQFTGSAFLFLPN